MKSVTTTSTTQRAADNAQFRVRVALTRKSATSVTMTPGNTMGGASRPALTDHIRRLIRMGIEDATDVHVTV